MDDTSCYLIPLGTLSGGCDCLLHYTSRRKMLRLSRGDTWPRRDEMASEWQTHGPTYRPVQSQVAWADKILTICEGSTESQPITSVGPSLSTVLSSLREERGSTVHVLRPGNVLGGSGTQMRPLYPLRVGVLGDRELPDMWWAGNRT